jgi:hypothetical protein
MAKPEASVLMMGASGPVASKLELWSSLLELVERILLRNSQKMGPCHSSLLRGVQICLKFFTNRL